MLGNLDWPIGWTFMLIDSFRERCRRCVVAEGNLIKLGGKERARR